MEHGKNHYNFFSTTTTTTKKWNKMNDERNYAVKCVCIKWAIKMPRAEKCFSHWPRHVHFLPSFHFFPLPPPPRPPSLRFFLLSPIHISNKNDFYADAKSQCKRKCNAAYSSACWPEWYSNVHNVYTSTNNVYFYDYFSKFTALVYICCACTLYEKNSVEMWWK